MADTSTSRRARAGAAPLRPARRQSAIAALGLATTLNLAAGVNAASPAGPLADEAPFLAENQAAMDKMMAGMDVKPSGDVDRDFAAMMIPHHQGAIDMAEAELRHGRNERLRRIAQEIIVEQQQEIAAMRLALDQPPLPPPAAALDHLSGVSAPAVSPRLTPMVGMTTICRSPQ